MTTEFTLCFLESIKDHQMTVIENSEHAKIFRFARPDTVALSCTIAYVANTCLITGDMGHYLFGRLLNPYDFFSQESAAFSFGYVEEKVLASDANIHTRVLDGNLAKSRIRRLISYYRTNCKNERERERWDELIKTFNHYDLQTESEVDEFLDMVRDPHTGYFTLVDSRDFFVLRDNFIWCVQAVVYATRLFEQETRRYVD